MTAQIRVNLHCHSNQSDGELSPAELADCLFADGVRVASLTDHDTLEGLEAFEKAASRKGIGCIAGIEISTSMPDGKDFHLLGYGFDPANRALGAMLAQLRALRVGRENLSDDARPGSIPAAEAIGCLHQAGGLAFWAHPIVSDGPQTVEEIEPLLLQLKEMGLDGIEAIYCEYSPETRESLIALAQKHDLLVCAGSDFHGHGRVGLCDPGIDIPDPIWKRFRNAVMQKTSDSVLGEPQAPAPQKIKPRLPHWQPFLLRIVFPTFLAIALFIFATYRIIIPSFEERLLERKREMIRELTNLAVGILTEYETEVREGRLSIPQAQQAAAQRIQALRYGKEGKDYFWVTDLHPRMIIHPYRPDLNGKDLSDFKDQRGNRIFVEFVNVVKSQDDGYVEYVWQWKDNPERLVPKQSYIRKFQPWGWIVGTGIYVEDVQKEIAAMESRMVHISLGITSLSALLLVFVALQSMSIENRRRRAEDELRESHEKYRTLVEAAADGILMVLDGRCSYANKTMMEMLQYSESEIPLLDVSDILTGTIKGNGGESIALMLENGTALPPAAETELRKKSGDLLRVTLTATPISFSGRSGFTLAARMLGGRQDQRQREAERENLISELQSSLMFLYEPVISCAGELVACDLRDSVSKAAALMTKNGSSAILITSDSEPLGIVTDHDMRQRLISKNLPPEQPVFQIMSSPLVSIDHRAMVYEAILLMQENHIGHLAVRDDGGEIVGIVDNIQLLRFHRHSLAILAQDIQRAKTLDEIVAARQNLPNLVKSLISGGAKLRNVTRAITTVSDAITEKMIELAINELGPPPARFAFLALGSEGREEQTLATDQDNAIVFEDVDEASLPAAREYFLKLGEMICVSLEKAGYAFCLGNIMARNPKWCQPLQVWKGYFSEWIQMADPKNILGVMTFFDLRVLYGRQEFASELRRHVAEQLAGEPPFFLHYAQYALQYKAPLGLFGNIIVESSKAHTFNIKEAMLPVVNFARLYALRHGVQETHTIDRLHELVELGVLKQSLHDEVAQVYDCLMQLRLEHQATAIDRSEAPNNAINPKMLTHMQETLLKEAFTQITNIQKKISYDFFGSA